MALHRLESLFGDSSQCTSPTCMHNTDCWCDGIKDENRDAICRKDTKYTSGLAGDHRVGFSAGRIWRGGGLVNPNDVIAVNLPAINEVR